MLQDRKTVYDKTLEALKQGERTRGTSIGIFLSAKDLKQGMSWDIFKACIHFLKDVTVKTRHIRLAFEDAVAAGVLKRKILRSKKEIRESLI